MSRAKIGLGMSTVARPTTKPTATEAMAATNTCGNRQARSAWAASANDDRWLFIQCAKRLMALLCPIVTILGSRASARPGGQAQAANVMRCVRSVPTVADGQPAKQREGQRRADDEQIWHPAGTLQDGTFQPGLVTGVQ